MKTKVLTWKAVLGGTPEFYLNTWLANNPKIDVRHVTQSESGNPNTASHSITYTIWYMED